MKTILLGGAAFSLLTVSAFGADLEMPIKLPTAPPPVTWTGCYAGAQVGAGWGQKDLNDSAGIVSPLTGFTSANLGISGFMLGGQIGCDYQFASKWVLGIEGAVSGGNITGNTGVAVPGDSATFNEKTDLLTSVTARAGYAWNDWLLYAKGGVAWAGDRYSVFDVAGTYDFNGLETRFGWTAGAGVEWALWNDWSLRLEYDYYGFGTRSVTFIDNVTGTVGPLDIKQNIQVVKLGLNFHVFAGPPVAPFGW
ncbi:MAG: outer membrane beta-barrel protein [Xanthobacteraceae bacterium]|nr:outer membrane beta-barrel protein [Xanthobacteraceae bacterium]